MSIARPTDDIVAIRALADRYSDAVNRIDIAGMAATYAEDGELVAFGTPFRGREALRKVFQQSIGDTEFMHQMCSGAVIAVDGDRATARWSVTEFTKRPGKGTFEMFLGGYEDELVRTKEGWLFAKRILTRKARARLEGQFAVG